MIEIKEKPLQGYRFIDLFAGIGGFHLALSSFGAECVFASEWDSNSKRVYESNFGIEPSGDITKIDEKTIPKHDILCAGFPCQAFSISGKQLGFNDTRGTLFFDIARIVKEKQPKIILMENVKNFEKHDNGKTLKVILNTLNNLNYNVFYKVLNSADFNIPQKRERIYFVCFRKDLNINTFEFPKPITLEKHLIDILETSSETEKLFINRNDIQINKEDNKFDNKPIRLGQIAQGRQGERIYSTKGTAITLSAFGGGIFARTGGYLIDGKVRRLTPRECARVMGFPDTYKLAESNNIAYQQFGNSVVVDVLQYILKNVVETLLGE